MPKTDSWPMNGITRLSGTGSCDSMASLSSSHSTMSNESLEYLSPEERACLMFLEETIDSLDTESDSGLSNSESDGVDLGRSKFKDVYGNSHTAASPQGSRSSLQSDLLVSGKKADAVSTRDTSSSKMLPTSSELTERDHSSGGKPKITTRELSRNALNVSDVIPPPPPPFFRDNVEKAVINENIQRSPFSKELHQKPQEISNVSFNKSEVLAKRTSVASSQPLTLEGLSRLRERASIKKPPPNPAEINKVLPTQNITVSTLPPGLSVKESVAPISMASVAPHKKEEAHEPQTRSPPPTAPKPKKFPPNIQLNTSIGTGHLSNHEIHSRAWKEQTSPNLGSPTEGIPKPLATSDPQKSRIEALKKLGLLKQNSDSQLKAELGHPLKHHRSMEALPVGQISLGDFPKPKPLPEGRVDNAETEFSHSHSMRPRSGTDLRTIKQENLFFSKSANFKSVTLERSGMGLASYMANKANQTNPPKTNSTAAKPVSDTSLQSSLRNSRPRPASLGNGKDFDLQEGDIQKEEMKLNSKIVRKSYPAPRVPEKTQHFLTNSIQITPKTSTEEDRKVALRKLGLLKD
ncbi:specifically androgen-regulated gene protein [Polypterus senegalus]|uniref:specifically androgen-regulated gene protein n=1 Tax=Polypterus senegalus TaxID=55291 RepID=UPI0019650D58|nr:specifically androgen-regulated gene protein [Polypterus senegalus]XP_039605069.1 specifically androgen-regulated gene protein [Polypterus senegalus]XP_039605070.1 specifically androgen-regulated gene protein [Polypterus senegalus]